MEMGYPGPVVDSFVPDKRNDPHILEIFRADGKLIE